jgi:hypothetical protein
MATIPRKFDTCTRYVLTKVDANGMRTLATPAQGRETHATEAEARERLARILDPATNADDVLRSVYGCTELMDVRPCECYAVHFDPVGVYFDDPEYRYTCQCTHPDTGRTGCWLFAGSSHRARRSAVSPVFSSLSDLFAWMDSNGFRRIEGGIWTAERIKY